MIVTTVDAVVPADREAELIDSVGATHTHAVFTVEEVHTP